jgi:WD40 repeat protein
MHKARGRDIRPQARYRDAEYLFHRSLMRSAFLVLVIIAGIISISGTIGTVSGAVVGLDWKVQSPDDMLPAGITLSRDGSTVFVGGSQLLVISSQGQVLQKGWAGTVAAMSAEGNYVVTALGDRLRLLDYNGVELWTRIMGSPIRAVAISRNGSLVVSADNRGTLQLWNRSGDGGGIILMEPVKNVAISPSGNLIVIASEGGLRYITPGKNMTWSDNTSGSLDTYIAIPSDGSTIYTAGYNRVSSHTSDGSLNWMRDVTSEPITDLACSGDGRTIVLGSQDKSVYVLDRQGNIFGKYRTGQWVNAVGVSYDGSVIAAGSIDRYLSIFNRDGALLGKAKTGTIIQPRSVAVSANGRMIVVADETMVYGYSLGPDPEIAPGTRINPAATFSVSQTFSDFLITTPSPPASQPTVSLLQTMPVAPPTTWQSPVSIIIPLISCAVAILFIRRPAG